MAEITFRKAERKDCRLILEFIRKLADYEKRLDEVVATESDIEKWVFDEKLSHVIFGELDGKTIGFALYYLGFSTYMGNANMHLEDLLIEPEYRGRGYGKAFLKERYPTKPAGLCKGAKSHNSSNFETTSSVTGTL
jgi:GNAT superfamily N-acetyltransferase